MSDATLCTEKDIFFLENTKFQMNNFTVWIEYRVSTKDDTSEKFILSVFLHLWILISFSFKSLSNPFKDNIQRR